MGKNRWNVLCLPAVCILAMASSAEAGNAEFHLDTSVKATSTVKIESRWLDVSVYAVDGDQVRIKSDVVLTMLGTDDRAKECLEREKVNVVASSNGLIIRQGSDRDLLDGCRYLSLDHAKNKLDVGIPAGTAMKVSSASGDVAFKGNFATTSLEISLASGNAVIEGKVASLAVESASGDVQVNVSSPLNEFRADLASGNVVLKGGAADVRAESASGDLTFDRLTGSAHVETASGEISLAFSQVAKGSILDIESVSGDVLLTLPRDVTLGGRIESVSGDIKSDLLGKPGSDRREFILVGQQGTANISTISGDISIVLR